jgi:biotin transporter BioY
MSYKDLSKTEQMRFLSKQSALVAVILIVLATLLIHNKRTAGLGQFIGDLGWFLLFFAFVEWLISRRNKKTVSKSPKKS